MPSDNELRGWIATSRRNRRTLKAVVAALASVASIASFADHRAGLVLFFVAAVTAISGFWILAGHLADWEGQLARRAHAPARKPRAATVGAVSSELGAAV